MKEGFFIKANWMMFRKPILDHLFVLGVEEPKAFYKKAKRTYDSEIRKLADFGKNDVLKVNLTHAVMLGAIYEHCNPKPDIDSLT